mmetsp:Transcript_14798/g.47125  ORF Transcript_14798/g.47125 Transcript_14798/m.47125 type:complete len:90 (-) Transcript_14798:347-616(-)
MPSRMRRAATRASHASSVLGGLGLAGGGGRVRLVAYPTAAQVRRGTGLSLLSSVDLSLHCSPITTAAFAGASLVTATDDEVAIWKLPLG